MLIVYPVIIEYELSYSLPQVKAKASTVIMEKIMEYSNNIHNLINEVDVVVKNRKDKKSHAKSTLT